VKRLALLLATLSLPVLGCNGGAKALPPRFDGPTAIAAFRGFTGRHPGTLHEYLAVANSRADDLRFVDTEDDQVVMSPTVVFPLSVPTREAHPARLLAVTLGSEAVPGADLLLVVGAGSRQLEVVETWDRTSRIAVAIDVGATLPAGTALLSLAAAPPGEPGRARVYAGLSGSKLAVVDFQRGAGGEIVAGAPVILDLAVVDPVAGAFAFEPLDIAVAPAPIPPAAPGDRPLEPPEGPREADRLFIATGDLVAPGVLGLAQVDVTRSGAPAVSRAAGIDARAPTRLVATARLAERDVVTSGRNPDRFVLDADNPGKLLAERRAYAFLDPASCGFEFPVNCGLATLRPDDGQPGAGLLPDPMGVEPFRTPIRIPIPTAIVAVEQVDPTGPSRIGLAAFASATGRANTTALAAIAGPTGVFFADLGRFSLANDLSFVDGDQRAAVSSAGVTSEPGKPLLEVASLGVEPSEIVGAKNRASAIRVRPGYVDDDAWSVTWKGTIPGFSGPAVVGRDADGAWLAFQADSGLAPPPAVQWFPLARLDRPELGVHLGDQALVRTRAADATACIDASIQAFLPPSSDYPAGAVRLASLGCLAADLAVGDKRLVVAELRAAGLILVGASFGYAGRPLLDADYKLEWAPDAGLDPEARAIARKCRRRHYPPSLGADALSPGPILEIRVTKVVPDGASPGDDPSPGTRIDFTTRSGFVPTVRVPDAGTRNGTRPLSVTLVRRNPPAPTPENPTPVDASYFYATFEGGQLLRIPQGGGATEVKVIQ